VGSVTPYETAGGKRYRVRFRKPDHSQGQKRGFITKKEAERYLRTVETAKDNGDYIEASAANITIAALGAPWLASLTHLKPSALDPIQRAWRIYVEPRWGATPISAIQFTDVQTWISEMTVGTAKSKSTTPGPRSATVVLRNYGILAAILDNAVKDRRITSNRARGVSLPRKVRKAHSYLTHDQVALLATSTKDHSTLVQLLAYTGLRWGEATGLRVRDLDTLKRRLTVRENAVRVNGKIVVGTPKSHASRTVPFPEFLTLDLARLCQGKSPGDLVFGGGLAHLVAPTHGGWFEYAIKRAQAIDRTFPRLTPHDLRHTAASLAISAGANVKAIQRMLGHASAAMTLDVYADLFDDDLDAVAVALNQARGVSSVAKVWPNEATGPARVVHLPYEQRQAEG
jgi:integrase